MTTTQPEYPNQARKDKKKIDDIYADMPSDRDFILEIVIEQAIEQEEFEEWWLDQVLDEMARESLV